MIWRGLARAGASAIGTFVFLNQQLAAQTIAAETVHCADASQIAGPRNAQTSGAWAGDMATWLSIQFRNGCDVVDEKTTVVVIERGALAETVRIRLPDGRERWVDRKDVVP